MSFPATKTPGCSPTDLVVGQYRGCRQPPVVFRDAAPRAGNFVRLTLSPRVAIDIGANAKRPGEDMVAEPVTLSVVA